MKLKCVKTFSISVKGKTYSQNVGDIFDADDASALTLIKISLAEKHEEPKPSRKAKVAEEAKVASEEVTDDAISEEQ